MTNGFQFSKSVSLGHIVATVGIIIAGFTFIYDLREAISILQFKGETVEQRLDRIVNRTDDQFDQIMDHLIRLEEKIDTLNGE
jgi:hypothetical protein|tara:strand:+ start:4729 stop:4977 length:249 start_codon:yes stop_codon:yes gene_type:complete